jgi:hypothetical protein
MCPKSTVERVCKRCGAPLEVIYLDSHWRVCRACRAAYERAARATKPAVPRRPSIRWKLTAQERVRARIDTSGDCSLWLGSTNRHGYGVTSANGQAWLVHRLIWTWTYGAIPDGLFVLHNCPSGDNPACCKPAHLWLGTIADNQRDMMLKGRGRGATGDDSGRRTHPERTARGERASGARLRESDVVEIRRLYTDQHISHRDLAIHFGVGKSTIGSILNGATWSHLP